MIKKQQAGLQSIHSLLIESRLYTARGTNKLATSLLDKTEYLLALIIETKDHSLLFERYLKYTCDEFGFKRIYEQYVAY